MVEKQGECQHMHSDNRQGCDSAQGVEFINVRSNLLIVLCAHCIASLWAGSTAWVGTRPPPPSPPPCPSPSPCPTPPDAAAEDRVSLSCRSRCATLPRAFFGSSSTTMKSTGTLWALSLRAAYSRNLCANSGLQGPFTTR